jgi:hypothetical protein
LAGPGPIRSLAGGSNAGRCCLCASETAGHGSPLRTAQDDINRHEGIASASSAAAFLEFCNMVASAQMQSERGARCEVQNPGASKNEYLLQCSECCLGWHALRRGSPSCSREVLRSATMCTLLHSRGRRRQYAWPSPIAADRVVATSGISELPQTIPASGYVHMCRGIPDWRQWMSSFDVPVSFHTFWYGRRIGHLEVSRGRSGNGLRSSHDYSASDCLFRNLDTITQHYSAVMYCA